MANLPLKQVPIVDYGSDESAMGDYRAAGEKRAVALGNRGPIRFDAAGNLDRGILDSYSHRGFYVFEGVLRAEELEDIERDVADMLERGARGAGRRSTARATRPSASAVRRGPSAGSGRSPILSVARTKPTGAIRQR